MNIQECKLSGVRLINPVVHCDKRGFFLESFSAREFENAGVPCNFIQDNHSLSVESGVVRGLHFQKPPFEQSKLIRVIQGSILDVIVDCRKNSPTFGQWDSFELSAENYAMLYIPAGFAHGFCTLLPNTEVLYKVDNYYSKPHDSGIRWNDPSIGIEWPVDSPILSEKDKTLPLLNDSVLPF
jgi:dTDP-4-dehydrorhamnose 3,5-epimerase